MADHLSDHRDVHDPLTCELCHAEGVGAELAALRAENERLKVEYDEATQALAAELADERTLTGRLLAENGRVSDHFRGFLQPPDLGPR